MYCYKAMMGLVQQWSIWSKVDLWGWQRRLYNSGGFYGNSYFVSVFTQFISYPHILASAELIQGHWLPLSIVDGCCWSYNECMLMSANSNYTDLRSDIARVVFRGDWIDNPSDFIALKTFSNLRRRNIVSICQTRVACQAERKEEYAYMQEIFWHAEIILCFDVDEKH